MICLFSKQVTFERYGDGREGLYAALWIERRTVEKIRIAGFLKSRNQFITA